MQSSANVKTKAEKKFAIVSFPDEYEHLFIVASQWLLQNESSQYLCLWPPYISEERVKLSVLKNEKPEPTWQKCNANLVIKCKTYEGAESIKDSIMKISARRSSLLFDQLQESMSSQTKPPPTKVQFKNCVFSESSLLILKDIMRKLVGMNIEEVPFSLQGVPRTVSAESVTNLPKLQIVRKSTSCQTEQINISSNINTVCDSCKSKDGFTGIGACYPVSKFKPVTGSDTILKGDKYISINIRIQSITCMKEYEDKSFEELRVESLNSGHKESASVQMTFGKPAQSTTVHTTAFFSSANSKPVFAPSVTENGFTGIGARYPVSKFKPVTGSDTILKGDKYVPINFRIQSITCMKEYEDKSFEELRVEELSHGIHRTSVPPPNPFRTFPFSSTFTLKKPIRKPRIYPLLFGTSSTTDGFTGIGASYPVTKFKPVPGSDTVIKGDKCVPINTRLQSIICMNEYQDKSFEELRVEGLNAGHKESGPVQMTFGTPAQSTQSTTAHTTAVFSSANSKPVFAPSVTENGFTRSGASYSVSKFKPVTGSDTILKGDKYVPINFRIQSITCMKEYEDKSFEELRIEDLVADHKGTSPVDMVYQKPVKLFHHISALASTVSFSGTNSKPVFDDTDIENRFKKTETSSYPAIKFKPVTGSDKILSTPVSEDQYTSINTQLQSITCMKEYEDKSFEELRVENLVADCKVSSPVRVKLGTPVQTTPSTFTFSVEKSKSVLETKDITSSFNEDTNKSIFDVQSAWNYSPFYVSSLSTGKNTALFKL